MKNRKSNQEIIQERIAKKQAKVAKKRDNQKRKHEEMKAGRKAYLGFKWRLTKLIYGVMSVIILVVVIVTLTSMFTVHKNIEKSYNDIVNNGPKVEKVEQQSEEPSTTQSTSESEIDKKLNDAAEEKAADFTDELVNSAMDEIKEGVNGQ